MAALLKSCFACFERNPQAIGAGSAQQPATKPLKAKPSAARTRSVCSVAKHLIADSNEAGLHAIAQQPKRQARVAAIDTARSERGTTHLQT